MNMRDLNETFSALHYGEICITSCKNSEILPSSRCSYEARKKCNVDMLLCYLFAEPTSYFSYIVIDDVDIYIILL